MRSAISWLHLIFTVATQTYTYTTTKEDSEHLPQPFAQISKNIGTCHK